LFRQGVYLDQYDEKPL